MVPGRIPWRRREGFEVTPVSKLDPHLVKRTGETSLPLGERSLGSALPRRRIRGLVSCDLNRTVRSLMSSALAERGLSIDAVAAVHASTIASPRSLLRGRLIRDPWSRRNVAKARLTDRIHRVRCPGSAGLTQR